METLGKEASELDSYDLDADSWVWIVGGFKGTTARYLTERYDPRIWAFDPQVHAIEHLNALALTNPKLSVWPFGLGNRSGDLPMREVGSDAATFYNVDYVTSRDVSSGYLVDARRLYEDVGAPVIDLLLLNCEGGEFEILPALGDRLHRFRYVLAQFHVEAASIEKYEEMRTLMAVTHLVRWDNGPSWVSWEAR